MPAVDARPGIEPNQNTGTQQDGGSLEWTQIVSEVHDYVVNLNNIDDNAPVFTSADASVVDVDENIGSDEVGVIFVAQTADADGEAITYSLANNFGLFEIDATTGEVRLAPGQSANFEVAPSYDLTIIGLTSV